MQRLGQHFLISPLVLDRLIAAANLATDDVVLEIGPGKGVLTKALAARVGRVIAIEKDRALASGIKEELAAGGIGNVQIIADDIRNIFKPDTKYEIPNTNYKVVANIPYYLTSHLIRLLLERSNPPLLMALMIQREVAERIVAKPPHMNLLAASVQFYGTPEIIATVPRGAFQPPPKVASAIIRITPQEEMADPEFAKAFFDLARMGFSQKRKTLLNNISKGLKLEKGEAAKFLEAAQITPTRRAQTLLMQEWGQLTVHYQDMYNN